MTISQDLCGWVSLKEQKISPLQYRINTFHNQNYYFLWWYSFIFMHWFRFTRKKGKVWRKQLNSYLTFPTPRCFFCSYGSKRKKNWQPFSNKVVQKLAEFCSATSHCFQIQICTRPGSNCITIVYQKVAQEIIKR